MLDSSLHYHVEGILVTDYLQGHSRFQQLPPTQSTSHWQGQAGKTRGSYNDTWFIFHHHLVIMKLKFADTSLPRFGLQEEHCR